MQWCQHIFHLSSLAFSFICSQDDWLHMYSFCDHGLRFHEVDTSCCPSHGIKEKGKDCKSWKCYCFGPWTMGWCLHSIQSCSSSTFWFFKVCASPYRLWFILHTCFMLSLNFGSYLITSKEYSGSYLLVFPRSSHKNWNLGAWIKLFWVISMVGSD